MDEAPIGTVVVTGGSSGLGAAIVRSVQDAGGTALVIDQRPPPFEIDHEIVDLRHRIEAEAATTRLLGRHRDVTGIVTAAGIDRCGPLDRVDGADWNDVVAVNLLGTATVIRAALPDLEANHGRIVTVASTLGLR